MNSVMPTSVSRVYLSPMSSSEGGMTGSHSSFLSVMLSTRCFFEGGPSILEVSIAQEVFFREQLPVNQKGS